MPAIDRSEVFRLQTKDVTLVLRVYMQVNETGHAQR